MIPANRVKATQIKPLFVLFFILTIFAIKTVAQGNLLLYPKRIVFEGSKKSQTLNLANTGKDTVRYLISVEQFRMKADGSFEVIDQPDSEQYFSDKYFRFFPRNVVLGPNEAQSVKIQLINIDDMKAGEYRSHLYFRAEADKRPLGENEFKKDTGAISISLVAVFGISIPVIIRKGESTTQVSLTNAALKLNKDSLPLLNMTFNRTGNMSVYGDLLVDHISLEGKTTHVGKAKGIALYAPNLLRHFNLLLDKNTAVDYHKGKLYITYTTQPDAKSIKIAGTELELF